MLSNQRLQDDLSSALLFRGAWAASCSTPEYDDKNLLGQSKMAKFPLSVREKNLAFLDRLGEVFYLNSDHTPKSLAEYKRGFTARHVRDIHEEVVRLWPKTMDINKTLTEGRTAVSGLYIGDYSPEQLLQGVVRHSLYAEKLLIADPFIYAHSVRAEYNPILNPAQYRTQTLRNVNLWVRLAPWIKAGIVEMIRTPDDFSHQLKWDALKAQQEKFAESPELQEAAKTTVEELRTRHTEKWKYRDLILSLPDEPLLQKLAELEDPAKGITKEALLEHVRKQRAADPDFLEVAGAGEENAQLHMMSTGAAYNMAKLTASLTGAYLVTDLSVKWKEIEQDRAGRSAETGVWSPFAKSFQEAEFRYLNDVSIEDALKLRQEERLSTLRNFLRGVWKQACDPTSFDKINAGLLADELAAEVAKAKAEWDKIDQDLLKTAVAGTGAGLLAAGPMIASGHGLFLAAGAIAGGVGSLTAAARGRKRFADEYPAAFFLRL